MDPIVVTGITTGIIGDKNTDYPQRLEWSVFAKNRDFLTLYAKALELFMAMDPSTQTPGSYFQICGPSLQLRN
jgi:hypothetical protein